MKRLLRIAAGAGAALATLGVTATAAAPPTHIDLPAGWQPEGIALHRGQLLVGSIPTGQIRRVNPRDGSQTTVVTPRAGKPAAAIGLKADRKDRVFVAGGPTGKAFVYNLRSGKRLATFTLNRTKDAFINDVVLFRRFAYFTDSRQPAVFEVRRDLSGMRRIPTPDIPFGPDFNANGIAATPDGRFLIVASGGALYRVNRVTGSAIRISVRARFTRNGDGLLLRGRRLLVVQNQLNRVADLRLTRSYASGRAVRTITSPDFDIPTTVARKGDNLFLPNARFGTTDAQPAPYWITRVPAR